MGIFNASTVIAAQKSFRALFSESFEKVEPVWMLSAMEAPSDGAEETYQWLGRVPKIKEWIDSKTLEGLSGFDYILKNKDWESTIEVDRNDFEDDRLGLHRPRIQELGEEAKYHPDFLLSEVRRDGSAKLAYDGQFFYDTDHSEGKSGVQSNIVTGTGSTVAQITADFRSVRARFRGFKDNQGRPFIRNRRKLKILLTIPKDLEGVFEELANATIISQTENVLKGAFEYVVDPELTDTNDWYADYVGAPIKPFIMQVRKKAEFVDLINPETSELLFMRKKLLFGVEARYNAGYGLWQLAIKVTNT